MAAFTLTQMNHTNRAVTPDFILIKPNMTNVNIPLLSGEKQLKQSSNYHLCSTECVSISAFIKIDKCAQSLMETH